MEKLTPLTEEQKKRTIKALNETIKALIKEYNYSWDLQNNDRINWLQLHIIKLKTMIYYGV